MQTSTRARVAPKKLTRPEITKAFAELRKTVVTGNDDYMVAYLDDIARQRANGRRAGMFRRWSHRNHMLLRTQARMFGEDPLGLYAGRAQWARVGREVRSGVQPKVIWAYAPVTVKVPALTTPDDTTDTDETPRRYSAGFRLVEVFDWTDTVSVDPDFVEPNWTAPLAVGDHATLAALAASSPVPVNFVNLGGHTANGWLDATGITVNSSMPTGNQIATLSHELGHLELGHLDLLTQTRHDSDADEVRSRCEQEAELTQWLVLKTLGLDETVGNNLTVKTANYLRSWSDPDTGEAIEGHKRRAKLLDARLEQAMTAADAIIDRLLGPATPDA
jgi:hypothetical protein